MVIISGNKVLGSALDSGFAGDSGSGLLVSGSGAIFLEVLYTNKWNEMCQKDIAVYGKLMATFVVKLGCFATIL